MTGSRDPTSYSCLDRSAADRHQVQVDPPATPVRSLINCLYWTQNFRTLINFLYWAQNRRTLINSFYRPRTMVLSFINGLYCMVPDPQDFLKRHFFYPEPQDSPK